MEKQSGKLLDSYTSVSLKHIVTLKKWKVEIITNVVGIFSQVICFRTKNNKSMVKKKKKRTGVLGPYPQY